MLRDDFNLVTRHATWLGRPRVEIEIRGGVRFDDLGHKWSDTITHRPSVRMTQPK
jgi:hypothetical protein